ncbi:uncharacterized protein B0H64DRAFT_329142 [Chaetomium fimeti]|uniref:Myb-like domain-containing protein n=1 Tax=Chaetomium fimeti TaxID=1854472 RepID=A0AAE0H9L8_9PEZI|nr:hypothetical protein B0H64DRAFT_329142 [Chaetomium fimeti]
MDDLDNNTESQREYSVSSVGSHYSPAPTASEADSPPATPNHYSLQVQAEHSNRRHILSPPTKRPPTSSPYSTVPPTPTHTYRSSPRKRSLSPSTRYPSHATNTAAAATSAAAPPPPDSSPRPFKRLRTATFHHAYLTLLNDDIRDAAQQFTPLPTDNADGGNSSSTTLAPSQLGLTHWSGAEKALFFSALARVGRDDAAGIAARVRTKGVLEVAAYLELLARERERERAEGGAGGRVVALALAAPAEVPAAVELGQECCAALEEAADAVSVRQEGHEVGVEKARWGERAWLVEGGNWRALEAAPPEGLEGSLGLFRVGNWLRLSGRVFMNSAVEEYNWARVEGEEPAVRATALEDFYTLAVEVTRRLVAATIFVGEGRVRARRELYPHARSRVWKQDVEAAALSLGFPTNSRKFWAQSARRLRLDVYDSEDPPMVGWEGEGEDEQDPMSYDEVERALGLESEATGTNTAPAEETESSEEELDEDMASAAGSDDGSVDLGAGTPRASGDEEVLPYEDEAEKAAITREVNEIFVHSALEYPKTGPQRNNLRNRIRAERAQEAYADKMDARASYYEEKRMWAMLERQPRMELVKPDPPEEPRQWTTKTVDDLVKSYSRTPGDWRSKLELVPSRWEMDYALVEDKKKAEAISVATSGDEI